ncbi:MAG: hypothetical protein AAFX87_01850 [Bacteroidota bacterium]
MRSVSIKNLSAKLFIVLISLNLACGGGAPPEENDTEVAQETSAPSDTKPAQSYYYINSINNESLAEITIEGQSIMIKTPTGDLFSKLKGDKRKYYDQSDALKYAVKLKGTESFKLRDGNEQLIWKVKVTADKIKVANNEEMTDAFEIKQNESGKIKLKRNDEELKAMRFDPNSAATKVGDRYNVRNFNGSLAMGVLLIDELGETEKYIICTELLNMQ